MKLKPIQTNITVSTPTEAEAKELLAILHENGWDVSEPFDGIIKETEGILVRPEHDLGWCGDIHFAKSIGHAILTLAEFKEKYVEEEKPQPKFEIGDWVIHNHKNRELGQIAAYYPDDKICYAVRFGDEYHVMAEHQLLPYTEPETKSTEDMETKGKESGETGNNSEISQSNNLSQNVANCDKPEDKELNLSELLKGHEGETFYSPIVGDCTLKAITNYIHVAVNDHPSYCFFLDGRREKSGAVVFFPSRDLYEQYPLDPYTAWMKWQEEQKLNPVRVIINKYNKNGELIGEYYRSNPIDFRTPADRDKCLSEIEAIIEKYSKK